MRIMNFAQEMVERTDKYLAGKISDLIELEMHELCHEQRISFICFIAYGEKVNGCNCLNLGSTSFATYSTSLSTNEVNALTNGVVNLFSKKELNREMMILDTKFEKSAKEIYESSVKKSVMQRIEHENYLRVKASQSRDELAKKVLELKKEKESITRGLLSDLNRAMNATEAARIERDHFKQLYGELKSK